MKRYIVFIVLLLSLSPAAFAEGEAKTLPLKNAIAAGAGISFPVGNSNNDFTDLHHGVPCFAADVNYRHYFADGALGVGAAYQFYGTSKDNDLLRVNYVAPTLTLRVLSDDDSRAGYITAGCGYLHYADRIRSIDHGCHTFNKGYFGLSFSLGYEWAWTKSLSSLAHIDFLTARWTDNEDYIPSWQRDESEKDNFQTLFKPKLMFIAIGIDLQFGK